MPSSLKILVAEDLPDSVVLLKAAFSRAGVTAPVRYVKNGEEAIAYLKGEGVFANRAEYPMPTMLLLDLKMPRLDGFGVLEWLRRQPELRQLVVVVFTASEFQADINRAFELGTNCYIVKPCGFDELQETVRSLEDYWLRFRRGPECAPVKRSGVAGRRVLLREPKNGRYFQGGGQWTDNVEHAVDFGHGERAVELAVGMELKQIEIVAEVEAEGLKINVRIGGNDGYEST